MVTWWTFSETSGDHLPPNYILQLDFDIWCLHHDCIVRQPHKLRSWGIHVLLEGFSTEKRKPIYTKLWSSLLITFYALLVKVKLPAPCWSRILPSAGAFRSAKTTPTTQTADSIKILVIAELPRPSRRPCGLPGPHRCHDKNPDPATEESVLFHMKQCQTMHRHHELLICLSLLLSLSGRLPTYGTSMGQRSAGPRE